MHQTVDCACVPQSQTSELRDVPILLLKRSKTRALSKHQRNYIPKKGKRCGGVSRTFSTTPSTFTSQNGSEGFLNAPSSRCNDSFFSSICGARLGVSYGCPAKR